MSVIAAATKLKNDQDRQRTEKARTESELVRKAAQEQKAIVQALQTYLIREIGGAETRFGRAKIFSDPEDTAKICDIFALEVDKEPPTKTKLMSIEYATWSEEMVGDMGYPEYCNKKGISIWYMPIVGGEEWRKQTFSEYTLKTDLQEFERWLIRFMATVIK